MGLLTVNNPDLPKRGWGSVCVWTLLVFIMVSLSSCSPEVSYRTLSFFFDGVPDFNKTKQTPPKNGVNGNHNGNQVATSKAGAIPVTFKHKPFSDHQCTACHDKGMGSFLLKPQPASCYSCHADFATRFKYVHGPVAGGYCSECHEPHKANNKQLLTHSGKEICTPCHVLADVMRNPVHEEIGDDACTLCHDPHGGSNRFVLK